MKSPGTVLKRVLHSKRIILRQGCQRSQLLEYMDRIGVVGVRERLDNIVQSLLDDIKYWRYTDKRIVPIPPRQTVVDLLEWVLKECEE